MTITDILREERIVYSRDYLKISWDYDHIGELEW